MREHKSKQLERRPFFFLGLVIALGMTLTAFEWKTLEVVQKIELVRITDDIQIIETISLPKPPPPPPRIPIEEIEVVEDIEEIEPPNIIIDTDPVDDIVDIDLPDIKEETVEEPVRKWVENMPEPEGGYQAFYRYVSRNLKYPRAAIRRSIQGKVFIQFIVDEAGNITNPHVVKGIDPACDEEALRVISQSPRWKPGRQGILKVKVQMILPITFRLE